MIYMGSPFLPRKIYLFYIRKGGGFMTTKNIKTYGDFIELRKKAEMEYEAMMATYKSLDDIYEDNGVLNDLNKQYKTIMGHTILNLRAVLAIFNRIKSLEDIASYNDILEPLSIQYARLGEQLDKIYMSLYVQKSANPFWNL